METHHWIPERHRTRLRQGWPHIFRTKILTRIPEQEFAVLYSQQARPNTSVALLVSLSILKELPDLSDEELFESCRFDLRFHYAPGLSLDTPPFAERTLYYFRDRV